MIPAAIVWGVVAIVLYPLTHVSTIILFIAWIYALILGLLEALAIPFRPISLAWQVPAQWLSNRSTRVQILIWGIALGPGLMTRNPYAGIWLLPLLLVLHQSILTNISIGILIGIAHGGARVFGILSTRRNLSACGSSLLTQWRWRFADGLMLLFGAGCLTVAALSTFLTQPH